jgi:hypothetical protein
MRVFHLVEKPAVMETAAPGTLGKQRNQIINPSMAETFDRTRREGSDGSAEGFLVVDGKSGQ